MMYKTDPAYLIVMSGGLDSTNILLRHAERRELCDVVYVTSAQHPLKAIAESKAIEKILKYVQKELGPFVQNFESVHVGVRTFQHDIVLLDPDRMFSQPIDWLYAAAGVLRRHHKSVEIGYIAGDQINVRLTELQTAWNNLLSFSKNYTVPLEFPYIWHRKRDLVNSTPIEVLKLIWTCEIPERKKIRGNERTVACGECPSCVSMNSALIESGNKEKWLAYHKAVGSKAIIPFSK